MLCAIFVAASAGGCAALPSPYPPPPSVLVVSLGGVGRADLVDPGGAPRAPSLARLAASGRDYAAAYTPWPAPAPAHRAAFTGTWPESGGGDRAETLAEVAQAAGWSTGAFVGGPAVGAAAGLDRGFQTWAVDPRPRAADALAADALAWIAAQSGPWFAWVHLGDAAAPTAGAAGALHEAAAAHGAAVAGLDPALDALFDGVGCAVENDSCGVLVIVFGDHGQSFTAEAPLDAAHALTPAVLRVPLVIAGPGVAREVDHRPVSLVDLAPTARGLMGLTAGPWSQGTDLLHGELAADRAVFARTDPDEAAQRFGAHAGPALAVVQGGSHTVLWADGSRVDYGPPLDEDALTELVRGYPSRVQPRLMPGPRPTRAPFPFGPAATHAWSPDGLVALRRTPKAPPARP